MELYIKQTAISYKNRFNIYDRNNHVVFHVVREFFSVGARAHLYNAAGEEIYLIKSKRGKKKAHFDIIRDGEVCGTVLKEFSLYRPKIKVSCNLYPVEVRGNFFSRDFEVLTEGKLVGSFHRKIFELDKSYEVKINDEKHAGYICALMLTVDLCLRIH